MERLIGCCGFKCYMCAAYEGNIHSEEERKAVCDKWKYYFDYEVSLEKMHCNGCRAQDNDAAAMIHGDCQYRSCVMDKGLENCRGCAEYPCEKLSAYHGAYKTVYESLKEKIKSEDEEGCFRTYIVD